MPKKNTLALQGQKRKPDNKVSPFWVWHRDFGVHQVLMGFSHQESSQNYWVQPNWCSFCCLYIYIYIYIFNYNWNPIVAGFGSTIISGNNHLVYVAEKLFVSFAGHSFASLRKQGVHVWVPVWRSGPFWYYSFWPVQSETKMRTWSLFIMRYTAIPRVIMSFCVSDNAFSSCIFFVGVRVPFRLEF